MQTLKRHPLGAALLAGVIYLGTCLTCPPAGADPRAPVLSTAELFVDLARDHGLNCAGKQTPADVLRIRTLLRAALRLDPSNSQACVWLYEIARLDGRREEAADMLERLATSDSENLNAFANWLDVGSAAVQTVEQRREWLNELSRRFPQPERQALVLTHLARLARQQLEPEAAADYARQALALWPDCVEAVLLVLDDMTSDTPPHERLRAYLRLLRLRPLDVDLAWRIGQLLDQNQFAEEALGFYEYALSVSDTVAPGWPIAADRLLDLAQNAAMRGDHLKCAEYASRAVDAQRGTYEADFFVYWYLESRANAAVATNISAKLSRAFAEIKEPGEWATALVAQAAWFYCVIDPQPQRALLLAENAAQRAPGDVFATRVLGWAQALNGRADDARQTLEPVATRDAFAAFWLAERAKASGDEAEAARIVRELKYIPPYGRAKVLLDSLNIPLATSRPAAERFPEVPVVLAEFDRRVFDFHKNPRNYVQAAIKPVGNNRMPGQPWWVELSITNTGPFPIPLGPEGLLNPVLLLSFHIEGDRTRDFPDLMTVGIDQVRMIPPGGTVRVWRTLDVGPPRTAARRVPQHLLSVTLTAILDPHQTPQGWQPSPMGCVLPSALFLRLPANTDPEAWHARFQRLKGDSPEAVFQVLEEFGELLGETQRAATQALTYKPQPIPSDRVQTVLRTALTSESWEMAVRGLDALQAAGLDRATLDEAQRCLENPHWAVRLMAVRLLARQGQAFEQRARQIAENDPDELVRDMARSYAEPAAGE